MFAEMPTTSFRKPKKVSALTSFKPKLDNNLPASCLEKILFLAKFCTLDFKSLTSLSSNTPSVCPVLSNALKILLYLSSTFSALIPPFKLLRFISSALLPLPNLKLKSTIILLLYFCFPYSYRHFLQKL